MTLVESGMVCEGWEGLTVDGKFPLLEWLGGWADRCVFLTVRQSTHTANIKLIQASGADADTYVSRWEAAKALPHPCLVQMMETGRYELSGTGVAYVVTEKAETFLSGIVPRKALDGPKVAEILIPIVDALAFVHEKGFVHGSLKPSSIVLIDDEWKLSSDEMSRAGEFLKPNRELDTYDAPEMDAGVLTPAADMWSLGIIVVEACSQRTPVWDRKATGDLGVPDWLAAPLREIARGCLRWNPAERISIERVKELLDRTPVEVKSAPPPKAERVAVAEQAVPTLSQRVAEGRGETAKQEVHSLFATQATEPEIAELSPRSRLFSNLEGEEEKESSKGPVILSLIVLLAVAAIVGVRYKDRLSPLVSRQNTHATSENSEQSGANPKQAPDASQSGTASAPQPAPASSQSAGSEGTGSENTPSEQTAQGTPTPSPTTAEPTAPPPTQTAQAPAQAVPPAQSAGSGASKPPTSAREEAGEERSEPKRAEEAPRVMNAKGAVAKRVLPSVAPGAVKSMQRPLQVDVRVTVNKSGGVSSARCLTQGPGNYFARVSQQAARSWRFKAPVSEGKPTESEWMLLFQYSRGRTDVIAKELR